MFRKKKTLLEQAQDLAHEVADALAPQVDRAVETAKDAGSNAKEQLGPKFAEAREQLAPKVAEAREQIAPRIADAREQLAPKVAEAREAAAPHVAAAQSRLVNDIVPAVQSAAGQAAEQAGPLADEAKRRGRRAARRLAGEDPEPKRGRKKWLLLAALIGIGVVVAKKIAGDDKDASWQSSYPPPAPAPTSAPTPGPTSGPAGFAGTAAAGGEHRDDVDVDSPSPTEEAADVAGADPGEAFADATEEPHPVTTPDAPVEAVSLVDTSAADSADAAGESPYGEGSAAPNDDGSAPDGFDIKGNVDSMKFHAPSSPWYDRTKAEVWFSSADAAEAAGFTNVERGD